ncbi:D-2-hydroxyacid dehydrogenase [Motilimonas sp. 1_MG-2023]|uniref:D-2-hydroxyacid dehydrogenase n=1 Tax=Motilimonas sp. 1_MG-2023 TaxID=3062672 RepID=UPI0026E2F278|nr:D-2-hydroxyacid dehydrogenase [Motilimonas sp. 1_MG-2023]MDO6527746.1 D-2-hydroxyacid dehydrogenase [Motilimonas sp. 1_MG-2023]
MSSKIVFLDRETIPAHININRPNLSHLWVEYPYTSADQVIARSQDAEVIITNKVVLDQTVLKACPKLKLVVVAATGTNNIDLKSCNQLGIAVYNITHYANQGVPEHALMLMLALAKNLIAYDQDVRQGQWQQANQFCFTDHKIQNLAGKTLGIIGAGALGQNMAQLGQALGMKVLISEHKGQRVIRKGRVSFYDVIAQADFISLHCPLTEQTSKLFSEEEFIAMKATAYLINTARGPLVDESALVTALLTKQIAGAATDVAATEPLQNNSPLNQLLHLPNFIMTPHIAWASDESLANLCQQLISNIDGFYQGSPHNRVI